MGRDAKPWWRKAKKAWYVKHGGKQARLHADKDEALRIWHRMLAGGEGGDGGTQSALPAVADEAKGEARTVGEVVAAYLAHVEATQKPASLICKRKTLDRFAEDRGRTSADRIDAPGVVAWIASHKGWGAARRWLAGIVVSACWRWAGMPLGKLGLASPRSRGSEAVMGEEAHRRLLEACPECYRQALRFLHGTGCRPGEMCALEAAHVDLAARIALLSEHKTDKSGKPRIIVLAGDALETVRAQMALHPAGKLFRDTKGNPITPHRLRHYVRKKRLALGLPEGTIPYAYRHSYATDALTRGVPDAHVAALLGHSVAVLHKHYSHLTSRMDALREAARKARPEAAPGEGRGNA